MRTIRAVWRLVRFALLIYGLWKTLMKGRWLAIGIALWKLLRKSPQRNARKMADITFVGALEPAIYRRLGWRKIVPRRFGNPPI